MNLSILVYSSLITIIMVAKPVSVSLKMSVYRLVLGLNIYIKR